MNKKIYIFLCLIGILIIILISLGIYLNNRDTNKNPYIIPSGGGGDVPSGGTRNFPSGGTGDFPSGNDKFSIQFKNSTEKDIIVWLDDMGMCYIEKTNDCHI